MKYHQITDGEEVIVTTKNHRVACCDCGLVHKYDFKVGKRIGDMYEILDPEELDMIILRQAYRDERATKHRRKQLGIMVMRQKNG